jgi:hypothetical protein
MEGYLKKQSQFWTRVSSLGLYQYKIPELFRGFGCWKGYTIACMKFEFYEFWEVNHEKQ